MITNNEIEQVFVYEGNKYIVEFDCEFDRNEVVYVGVTRVEVYEPGLAVDADVFAAAVESAQSTAEQMQLEYVAGIEASIGEYWLP